MPLLNYTTEVPATRSIAAILEILQNGGASAIVMQYDTEKRVTEIHFRMNTVFGETAFALPANIAQVSLAINAQIRAETDALRQRKIRVRRIPSRLFNDREQAERIAWRIVKDWIEVNIAIDAIGSAKLEQVLIPFAVDNTGKTFYQRLVERGGPLLLT